MIARIKKVITISIIIIYAFMLILNALIMIPLKLVSAEDIEYSDILDDLTKDKTFNTGNYDKKTITDYITVNGDEDETNDIQAVKIIHIAESTSKELYIYTYQCLNGSDNESLNLECLEIAIWTEYVNNGKEFHPELYELELVDEESVFNKYVVKDFVVSDEVYRHYCISEIFREFNEKIDKKIQGVEDIKKAESVGQQWVCYFFNDNLVYEMAKLDVVEIEVTGVDSIRFEDGLTIGSLAGQLTAGDAWFVSFNVENYDVAHIYDADLKYKRIDCMYSVLNRKESVLKDYGDYISVYLTDSEGKNGSGSYDGQGWFSKDFEWNRISTGTEFKQSMLDQKVTLSPELSNTLDNSEWVFAFCETPYKLETINYGLYVDSFKYYSDINSVAILRLHFRTPQGTYNLGTVADIVSPDNIPGGYGGGIDLSGLKDSLEDLLAILAVIALLVLLGVAMPVLKYVLDFVIWLVKLPFKVIKNLWKGK